MIAKEINGLPIYDFTLDSEDYELGVKMMSFVDDPAIEKNFMFFSKQKQAIKLSVNEEKRIVTGVALRANYPIYRRDGAHEYYMCFSPEQISKIVEKFMEEKLTDKVNIMHDSKKVVSGVYLVESFLLNEINRKQFNEFDDVANGSWVVSYKVKNNKVWKKIKCGELKGFSVEIYGNADLRMGSDLSGIMEFSYLLNSLENE